MEISTPGSRDPHDRKEEKTHADSGNMNNLLAGTGAAAVFVDHQLHIVRFTPGTIELINMIHSDIGRPIGHIVRSTVVNDTHIRYLTGCG